MFGSDVEKSPRLSLRSAGERTPPCTTTVFTFLPKMDFGSSVLHIVVEPAMDCCWYVGVVDAMEQLLMVHIVECSCQIEHDDYCSEYRLFS